MLQRDVEFWLDPTKGNANIALTLERNRGKQVVTLNNPGVEGQIQMGAEDPREDPVAVDSTDSTLIDPCQLCTGSRPAK
jgi:hypothetical protein